MEQDKQEPNQQILVTNNTTTTSSSTIMVAINSSTEFEINSGGNQSFEQRLREENNKNSNNLRAVPQLITSGTNVYQMLSRPRGFCIIINNVDFDDNRFPKRIGSDEESIRLSNIFSRLHFEVKLKRNQSRDELLNYCRYISRHTELKNHDCLAIIILSHGNSGQIIASDNLAIEFEKVLTIFNNQNCHQLIKKPKMFFFNCCRGSTLDFGPLFTAHRTTDEVDKDVVDATLWPHVPIISDIMICYSTIDGYVSWRNEHNGTWFGSALANALENNAHALELNQILTIASDIVHNRTTRNGAKQAIEWKYRAWTKSLYFNPDNFIDSGDK